MKRRLKLRKASQPLRALQTVIDGELEVITPMHVGSGEDFCISDYIASGSSYARVNTRKLFDRFGSDDSAMAVLEDPRLHLGDFLYEQNVHPEEVAHYRLRMATRRQPKPGDRVLEFARAGVPDQPYVPGSSLKGALVSGMLWMINAEARDKENPLWVSDRFRHLLVECRKGRFPTDTALVESLLGREAHNRLGRVLHVKDIPASDADLALFHGCLFHMASPQGGHEWTGFRGRKVYDDRDASPHYLEALSPRTTLPVTISFDEFVLREARRKKSPVEFPKDAMDNDWLSPAWILSGVMDLAYNTLFQEQQFFERAGHERLAEATAALFQRCESLAENEVMLRLGWGLNWHGVTGYLWDDQVAKKLKLPQREKNAWPFPKSRRVMFDGHPLGTPGWAILRINGTRHLPEETDATPAVDS